jgi:hypothetical protein
MKSSAAVSGVARRVLLRAGLWFPFCISALYAVAVLFGFAHDTFHVTTTAFAVMMGLAGVFFGFGRVLDDENDVRDKVVFCGERALHGALYMLTAAVIEFGFQRGEKFLLIHNAAGTVIKAERLIGSLLVALFFVVALVEVHRAMQTIYGLLETRRHRRGNDVK